MKLLEENRCQKDGMDSERWSLDHHRPKGVEEPSPVSVQSWVNADPSVALLPDCWVMSERGWPCWSVKGRAQVSIFTECFMWILIMWVRNRKLGKTCIDSNGCLQLHGSFLVYGFVVFFFFPFHNYLEFSGQGEMWVGKKWGWVDINKNYWNPNSLLEIKWYCFVKQQDNNNENHILHSGEFSWN